MELSALSGGFDNAAHQSATAFRAIMNVTARPGVIETVSGAMPPKGLSIAAGSLLLTLCDPETKLYLAGGVDSQPIRDWLTFHTGAPLVPAAQADFALGAWEELLPLTQYAIGTDQYPDRSATLIVEMPELSQSGATLTGPGIKDSAQLSLPSLEPFQLNAALFPLGCDFFFTAGDKIAALPRTTKPESVTCM
ncbi:phosphonate C-P lyase system protein PhnH [Neptunicoccus cionae]|uniref:Carbon-phosphorus lyase subunit PhnH n=1 Tax=Neptunicoccus cionae TaxID=2035344 RepID=A0A916QXC0_9RHOB|nr:phosphonate C-P lyase system protein PhnH [Amylibacter cionae]GGA17223.1 carbon-phosphorus lyase subunit PhnH [Amylibacter cionae]